MLPPDTNTQVTILGAGIVGICTALSLLERGVSVRLIDKGAPGQETSLGNAGVVSPWSIIPQATPGIWKAIPKLMFGSARPLSIHPRVMAQMVPWGLRFLKRANEVDLRAGAEAMSHLCAPSIEIYEKHLNGTGHEALLCNSMYVHAFRDGSRANLQSLDYRIRAEKGAELELVGRDRLAEIEPALSAEFQAAILVKDQARIRSPGRLGQVLAEKAARLGASFVTDEVTALLPRDGGWHVHCKGESFAAKRVVISLGAWSTDLLKHAGFKIPLMAERGYHVEFPDPDIELNNSVMDVDAKFVASSMEGGLRVAGQAEFAPVSAKPNPKRKGHLVQLAQATFEGLRTENPRFWMGRRPSFPDSLPMLGRAPDHEDLFFNFGHSHYGLMMAPKSGDVLAQMMCGEHTNFDLSPYGATRFG